MVGPFLTEATANAWADSKGIEPRRRVIRPLESPTSIYGYGRHALIPSPTARRVVGPRGGISGVLNDVGGPPPADPGVPPEGLGESISNPLAAGALAAWEAKKAEARRAPKVEPPPLQVDDGTEFKGGGLTGGIRHWITGEALALAPHTVMSKAEAVATWSGPLAHFDSPTTDGRVLALNSPGSGDWLTHFARVPVGVWVMVPNVGALPIGLCERVRVEDGWLLGEGRVSIGHFQKAAPALFAKAFPSWDSGRQDDTVPAPEAIPAAIDVTHGTRDSLAGVIRISGAWELDRVVFGSVPAWPGCQVHFDDVQLGAIRG